MRKQGTRPPTLQDVAVFRAEGRGVGRSRVEKKEPPPYYLGIRTGRTTHRKRAIKVDASTPLRARNMHKNKTETNLWSKPLF